MHLPARLCLPFLGLLASLAAAPAPSSRPIEGLRDASPRVHALTGARIVVAPGQVIEKGTLVLRDGLIAAVGADVTPPAEARIWDLAGRTLYAGFIEPQAGAFLPAAWKSATATAGAELPRRGGGGGAAAAAAAASAASAAEGGVRSWNPRLTPERSVAHALVPEAGAAEALRTLGFTAANLVPARGIFRGSGALVSLPDEVGPAAVIRADSMQQVAFEFGGEIGRGTYPSSLMGAVALVRQTLLDAQWYAAVHEKFGSGLPGVERPEVNLSLAALGPVVQGQQAVFHAMRDELDAERAIGIAREFGLRLTLVGTGTEYRVLAALKGAGVAVITPLAFPEAPAVETSAGALEVTLDQLQHWNLAAGNAGRLTGAGVKVAFTTAGLRRTRDFWTNVRRAIHAGLTPESALAALTTVPAELLGARQLGTLEVGRAGHVVVADGDLFRQDDATVQMVWVDGAPYPLPGWDRVDARGAWAATWEGATGPATLSLSGRTPARLTGRAGEARLTVSQQGDALVMFAPVSAFGGEAASKGTVRLTAQAQGDTLTGAGELPDGTLFRWRARRTGPAPVDAGGEERVSEGRGPGERGGGGGGGGGGAGGGARARGGRGAGGGGGGGDAAAAAEVPVIARANVFPAGAYGRAAIPEQPAAVLFRHATVWTSGPAGVLEGADVLVEQGRIKQVGRGLAAPEGAQVIDATGRHLTPGLIDCHSHIAINGGVNEGTSAVTCEVRISDVLDPTDINLYRQLASGVTASNLLHGSANPIGGQNQVIKLRWGQGADGLRFAAAMPGVKFALGENVTRANFPAGRGRYPLSRMGVGEIMRDTFARAAELTREQAEFKAGRRPLPPRRDLRLEAAAEMLAGGRLIHIHSYRQDEVLMFIRLAQELKLPVATFQHILEGYKVAPEIAALGAGASTFSDWWGFKFEVYDAIPWNGALLRAAGVNVSFNSDDPELARRLNTEAAKAVRYGGVPPAEALQFVTLNPARQLRIDARVGSLEPGKDADLVVWSGSPLSTYSRVEQTWIDGRRYFSREEDAAARAVDAKERAALIQLALPARQRALAAGGGGEGEGGGGGGGGDSRPGVLRALDQLVHGQAREIYSSGREAVECRTDNL